MFSLGQQQASESILSLILAAPLCVRKSISLCQPSHKAEEREGPCCHEVLGHKVVIWRKQDLRGDCGVD